MASHSDRLIVHAGGVGAIHEAEPVLRPGADTTPHRPGESAVTVHKNGGHLAHVQHAEDGQEERVVDVVVVA